jgi:Zn-dependent M28 family amino/carboxypeptidase
LQSLYEDYFKTLPPKSKFADYVLDEMTGGSDFFSFLEVGIPSGGLATGASVLKTEDERHRFGGLANAAHDPCYHQSCDTLENIAVDVLEQMAKSTAHVTESLGMRDDLRVWLSS